jgi:hypothetical protein
MQKRVDELREGDRIFFNEAGRKETVATVIAVAPVSERQVKVTLEAWGARRDWHADAEATLALAPGDS